MENIDPFHAFTSVQEFYIAILERPALGQVINYDDNECQEWREKFENVDNNLSDDNNSSEDIISEKRTKCLTLTNADNIDIFIDLINNCYNSQLSSFVTSGTVNSEIPIKFKIHDTVFDFRRDDIQPILNTYMTSAKFGNFEQQTVYDPEIRTAWQCSADICTWVSSDNSQGEHDNINNYASNDINNGEIYPDFLKNIYAIVKDELIESNFELQPYKFNIYGPGGFFKSHKDTPIDAKYSIATLVISIPYGREPCVGGNLTIRCADKEYIFSTDTSQDIKWVAFFTDCEHEVSPITSGYRLTLTYNIINNGHEYEWTDDIIDNVLTTTSIHSVISGPRVSMPADWQVLSVLQPYIGIFLQHEYTLGNIHTKTLKGPDLKLYTTILNSKNLTCKVTCVLYEYVNRWGYEGCPANSESSYEVYPVTLADWQKWLTCGQLSAITSYSKLFKFFDVNSHTKLIKSSHRRAGYMGNEGCDGEDCRLYFSAVLLVMEK